ncbi:MAG TPA: class I SAM-dependent methyltransferase [Streptosporangiaceae bacterium]
MARNRTTTRPTVRPADRAAAVDLDTATALYRKFRDPLGEARTAQRALLAANDGMKAQLDDVEAELTYLFLRDREPGTVVEIGALHGWSTTWILRALRDNGGGRLRSYDLIDRAGDNVPEDLAAGRWTFHHGDVRTGLAELPDDLGYLFIDAAHTAGFARWYIERVFPRVPPGTPVSVHDVFHGRRPKPFSEGSVIVSWLADNGVPYFTASPARAPEDHARLGEVKRDLGLAAPLRTSRHNPMLYFRMP